MTGRITTLAYELRTVQRPFMVDLGNVLLHVMFGQYPTDFSDKNWSMDKQVWEWTLPEQQAITNGYIHVECINWGWSPDSAAPDYGDESIVSSTGKVVPGRSLLWLGKDSTEGLEYNNTEVFTLHRERSVTVNKGLEFTEGVEIGGSIPGTGFETKVSAEFKQSFDTSTAESESKDNQSSQSVDYDFQPFTQELLKASTSDIRARGSVDVDGIPEWGIKVTTNLGGHPSTHPPNPGVGASLWWHYADKRNRDVHDDSHETVVSWPSITDLVTMLDGSNDRWPGFWDVDVPDSIRRLAHNLLQQRKRRVQLSGTVNRDYESIPTFEPIDVSGEDPDDIAAEYGLDDNHILKPDRSCA